MTKAKISEYSATAGDNTDVNGVNIAEGCPPSSMNNMGREIMAALKRYQVGSDGDGVTVGGNLVVSGSTTANTFTAGPVSATTLNTSGQVVFNDAGADVDFRVEGDTDANLLFVDASTDRVGIGTSSPDTLLNIQGIDPTLLIQDSDEAGDGFIKFQTANGTQRAFIQAAMTADVMLLGTGTTERMRIDSSGNLLVGCTAVPSASVEGRRIASGSGATTSSSGSSTSAYSHLTFINGNGGVGSVQTSASATSYNTSSDYRLKHDIQQMTGALAKVSALKPCTYKWNADDSAGEGFIAHELQAVVPDCVTGEKDAVEIYTDENGVEQSRPVYQGIDSSFLVATLTAAIQELKAINDAQAQTIESLTARVAALEAQ